jgi:adenosyl cobinamide kinase/adenosyl cobinamide phosphate guanylyltransferase
MISTVFKYNGDEKRAGVDCWECWKPRLIWTVVLEEEEEDEEEEEEEKETERKQSLLKKCKQTAVLIIWTVGCGWKNIVSYFYPRD